MRVFFCFLAIMLVSGVALAQSEIDPKHQECAVDSDCVGIRRGGCCGADEAVNVKYRDLYDQPRSRRCDEIRVVCQPSFAWCKSKKCFMELGASQPPWGDDKYGNALAGAKELSVIRPEISIDAYQKLIDYCDLALLFESRDIIFFIKPDVLTDEPLSLDRHNLVETFKANLGRHAFAIIEMGKGWSVKIEEEKIKDLNHLQSLAKEGGFSRVMFLQGQNNLGFVQILRDVKLDSHANNGDFSWSENILKTCGVPVVGEPMIRDVTIEGVKARVVYGKHSYAEVDLATGEIICLVHC